MRLLFSFLLCSASTLCARAQYPPQAGVPGSDAVSATSPLISGWATGCSVQRGWKDIADPALGYTSAGDTSAALGPRDGAVVSLGDSGVATLSFAAPIFDGPGPDFAVFENGFPNPANSEEAFLELAFVEVSSDGTVFVRFPARCLLPDSPQLSSVAGENYVNARQLHNLAGKHIAGWGTPFDLAEVAGLPGLDVSHITHIRLVGVVGSIGMHASYDAADAVINDPYPTPFPTGGFDLDAVAALHGAMSVSPPPPPFALALWPLPVSNVLYTAWPAQLDNCRATILNAAGKLLWERRITRGEALDLTALPPGAYFLHLYFPDGGRVVRPFTKI